MADSQDALVRLLKIIRQLERALEAGNLDAAGRAYDALRCEQRDHPWMMGYLDEVRAQLDTLRQESRWWADWPEMETDDGDTEPLDVADDTRESRPILYTRVQPRHAAPVQPAGPSRN